MPGIDIKQLKQIIREEIQKLHEVDEYKDGSKVMKSAADLISAIETFKQNASASSKSFVSEDVLDSLKEKLDIIARNSMNYIDVASKPNPAVKKAVFKPSV
jgi:hypothetical protein